ncbi:uncharacterized protein LOC127096471 [Lathyrus oleraceus]|uniref:uncharacterized protein LOC127096471 n=1 Tax=Pisum sativum TaxID=3888 RepID=UPI0021D2943F|nr:uncharacterized protein LOC127096471 [Pisum sativum]
MDMKEPQTNETKVATQVFDEENTLLVMITKGECNSSNKLQDECSSTWKKTGNSGCNRLPILYNWLQEEESAMVTMKDAVHCNDQWKKILVCYNHCDMKNKVKFTDDTALKDDGINDIFITRRDGEHSLIKDVLYIPGIKCNLLNIGQLLVNDYKIHMENKALSIMYVNMVFILKAPIAANRTFKVELKVMENRCLATTTSQKEWIWHYKLGHLNFRDLNALQKNIMVTRMSLINIPAKICE